jgi:methionyl-tRNA formyltransferase
MGTPAFAVTILRALKDSGHEVAAVYCQPPKPAGRGKSVQKAPVQHAAEEMGLAVHTPKSLRDSVEQKIFVELALDIAVVVAYGLILPKPVLDAPRHGCVNIHYSLLPRWRGAAPVQRAILAGDKETGIDIMRMDEGLDTGPVLLREKVPIPPRATAGSLFEDLAPRSAKLILRALDEIDAGSIRPMPQPKEGALYAAKLARADGLIDWTKPALEIERQIRAFQPWPGAFFTLGAEAVKVLAAEIVPDKSGAPGTLCEDQFTVACGTQALRLLTVQRAGKNPVDGASFLRGARFTIGQRL